MATKKAKQRSTETEPSFEQALSELEAVVERLESQDISLDESLQLFERGMQLKKVCQSALASAEQRVRILTEKTEQAEPQAFEADR